MTQNPTAFIKSIPAPLKLIFSEPDILPAWYVKQCQKDGGVRKPKQRKVWTGSRHGFNKYNTHI